MGFLYYESTSNLISHVTKMLNESVATSDSYHHIEVRLVETESQQEIGRWSDEIADDAWSYEETWNPKRGETA